MLDLNENENKILEAIKNNAQDISGDSNEYALLEELHFYINDLSKNQILGYVGDLAKKHLVKIHTSKSNFISFTQLWIINK